MLVTFPNAKFDLASRLVERRRKRSMGGVMVIELLISMGILALVLTSSMAGLLNANRQAAVHRTLTAARAIVLRNIETALAVSYSSDDVPAILAITAAAGVVYDDDGGSDNKVNILVQNTAGTTVLLQGVLTRTVLAETNPQSAAIRRITFSLAYTFRGRNYTTAMTTLRAIDDY
jgi:hypothetical protein